MNASRRVLTAAIPSSPGAAIMEIPQSITSAQLPRSIFKYVLFQLDIQKPQEPDPTLAQIAAPESEGSQSMIRERVSIPNPFLLQKRTVNIERVDGSLFPLNRYTLHVSKRNQKKLLALHPRYHLPPSSVNPIETPPKVIWEQNGKHFGKEIAWAGDWEVKQQKGLYHGRKVMFKGHKRERERQDKWDTMNERVEDMGRRVEEWRSASRYRFLQSRRLTPLRSKRKLNPA